MLTKYLDLRIGSLLIKYFGSMGPRMSIAQDVNRKRVWTQQMKSTRNKMKMIFVNGLR